MAVRRRGRRPAHQPMRRNTTLRAARLLAGLGVVVGLAGGGATIAAPSHRPAAPTALTRAQDPAQKPAQKSAGPPAPAPAPPLVIAPGPARGAGPAQEAGTDARRPASPGARPDHRHRRAPPGPGVRR